MPRPSRPRGWNRLSLRRRVIAGSAMAITLAGIIAILSFGMVLERILYAAARDSAQTQAAQIAALIQSGGVSSPERAVHEVPSRGSLIQILSTDQTVLAASDKAAQDAALTDLVPRPGQQRVQRDVVAGEGQHYAVAARGLSADNRQLVLVVAVPLAVPTHTVRVATVMLSVAGLGLGLLLLLLISAIVSSALQPVERIREQVAGIQQVRSGERITVLPFDDEISRLADTMNEMLQRLDRADSSTRQFVSDASHELRSPLATIRAAVETGMLTTRPTGPGADDPHHERYRVIQGEVLRLQRLVDDLLTLAKADDDGLQMRMGEVDLDDLVDAEVRRLRATSPRRIEASISAARVYGDPNRLAQVLRNLTDNAVRHSKDTVTVTVGTEQTSNGTPGVQAVLTVDNDGPPIPVADRERVFARFARLQSSRERDAGGSGLGLAIAKMIVNGHGGTVVASQTPQNTCRFEVRLPG